MSNVSVQVAMGLIEDGYRKILGICDGTKEDKAGWSGFLRRLKKRGLWVSGCLSSAGFFHSDEFQFLKPVNGLLIKHLYPHSAICPAAGIYKWTIEGVWKTGDSTPYLNVIAWRLFYAHYRCSGHKFFHSSPMSECL